ncbi:uncharacterized protein [Ptychodera flava]|uniref:uncharacterized protein n=1 Tax=Ptychodera flava TaxID=63121 RepID=UPI00396A65F9
MLKMASEADQLFSIGPAIYDYFQNAYRAEVQGKDLSEIPHEEILPQAMECFRAKEPKLKETKGPQRHNILTYGEPMAIEKCTGIAGSIGSVADQLPTTPPKWKIQGVSRDADHTALVNKMKTNRVLPILHSGDSAGELLVSLQQSHLCIPAPVYMDYGFNGLEAVVFGLPTVLTYYSELAYFIRTHFGIYEDNLVVGNHEEESLKKKILQHLVDPSKAFHKAKALKEDLLKSEVVSESYAKFASMLTMPVGKYGGEDSKMDATAGKITANDDKDDKPQPHDESKSQPFPEHGNILPETGVEDTSERDEKEEKAKSTYSETGNPEIKQNGTPRPDDLTVLVELDDASFHKTLKVLDEQSKADFNQLGEMEEKQNAVQAALSDCQMKLTQRSEEVVDNEQSRQEMENTIKEKLGDVDVNSFKAESLAILLRFLTLYNLYRLKQTCRSRSLAKAFEPLLITDEMREIAAKVGVAPLRLKVTYDQKKFREVELFFINRDGGGVRPLKSYDDIIDEVIIEDNEWDVSDSHDHQPMGDTAMTDVVLSKASKMLLLEIDPKLEMKPSTETNVRSLLNPVKLTRQRGKQYDILQVVMAMTDRIQHILSSRLEILALLGFVRYLLTVVAGADGRQSFSELDEQLFLHGKPILPITAADETLSLQARSLLPFQISQECLKDSVIRYLAIEKSKIQSLHSQLSIKESEFLAAKESLENQLDEALKEKSKFKTAKEILENQLDETLQEKSQLEKRFKEQSEKDNKVIITQHTDYLILKDRLEKLEPNITDLQSKLEQKDKFISELMTKLTKLSDAQSNVALQKIITETVELGEEFITGEAQWEGETVSDTLGKEETPETQKTATETSIQDHETTTLEEQGAASTETKKVEGDWSKLTLDGQGPYPGQKFNNPCGLTFHDDKLLVCDRLNNIVQILNQDYTCEKVLGSFSGQFAKPFQPVSIAVSQDNHYFILDDNNLQIVVCDQNNKVISIITLPAGVDPRCIALLKGFVLVTDVKGHRLLKYTKTGRYIKEVGSLGRGHLQFNFPASVAVNSKGVIIVSDCFNHRIKCFDSDFNYLYQYGEKGNGDSQLYFPFSIAIDGADNVYVSDHQNARISMWSRDRTWI